MWADSFSRRKYHQLTTLSFTFNRYLYYIVKFLNHLKAKWNHIYQLIIGPHRVSQTSSIAASIIRWFVFKAPFPSDSIAVTLVRLRISARLQFDSRKLLPLLFPFVISETRECSRSDKATFKKMSRNTHSVCKCECHFQLLHSWQWTHGVIVRLLQSLVPRMQRLQRNLCTLTTLWRTIQGRCDLCTQSHIWISLCAENYNFGFYFMSVNFSAITLRKYLSCLVSITSKVYQLAYDNMLAMW